MAETAAAGDPSCPPFPRQPGGSPGLARGPGLEVPALDLARLDQAGLAMACRELGLFRLAGHGLPAGLEARLFGLAREFLGLPFEDKKARFAGPPVAYFWGTPAVSLRVREVNWVEGLHVSMGREGLDVASAGPGPDGPSLLSELLSEYNKHMARIARSLFDALAAELGLGEERCVSYLSEHEGTLRVYRYPPCPAAAECLGMEAHTDSSVLSIVNQDLVGGLQVLHNDKWFDVPPVSGTLVVNLGDMMQAMSSDLYRSVRHRVVARPSAERLSLCYFAFPAEESVIESCRYRPFTYREFRNQVQEDIKATGSKIGLSRFAIDPST